MSVNFTNVVKPTHLCNLSCAYCYNEDTRAPVMEHDTLVNVIQKTLDHARSTNPSWHVDFIWHGGEPMLAKMDFYRDVVEIQSHHSSGLNFSNSIQTNATLVTSEWAKFFKDHKFRVSVSIDGPKHINDSARKYSPSRGSFDAVMRGIKLLREEGLQIGVCVVITKESINHVDEIWDFLVSERLPFNVIPLTRSGDALANYEDLGLGAEDYAAPWIKLFDRWIDAEKNDYIYCSDFVFKTRAILSGSPQDCIAQKICSFTHFSTDPDGYVYPCATLSGSPEWRYGNINEMTVASLLASPRAVESQNRQIDPHCVECKWQHVCHGGCMQRAYKYFGTHNTRDYYCPSLYKIYEHIEAKLRTAHSAFDACLPKKVDVREPAPLRPIVPKEISHKVRSRLGLLSTANQTKEGE